MKSSLIGRCMCGGVAFTLHPPFRPVFNCHCDRCRRFSGHHVAATAVAPDGLVFATDETLGWHEPAIGVFYGFCRRCGSSLFFRTDRTPERISVMAGALDQPTGLTTTEAWWVDGAGDYHTRPSGLIEHGGDG
jgi:hypothetical protein